MTEPIDPNPSYAVGDYVPPPPFAPQETVYAYPALPQPPPEPRRRSPRILFGAVAVAVVALTAATALIYDVATSSDEHGDTIAVPASFDGYLKLTDDTAERVESAIRNMATSLPAAAALLDRATIATYARGGVPRAVMIAVPTSEFGGTSTWERTDELLEGAVRTTAMTKYPYPPKGGSTECGPATFGTVSETMCAWSDDTITGLLISLNPPLPPKAAYAVVNAFRAEIE